MLNVFFSRYFTSPLPFPITLFSINLVAGHSRPSNSIFILVAISVKIILIILPSSIAISPLQINLSFVLVPPQPFILIFYPRVSFFSSCIPTLHLLSWLISSTPSLRLLPWSPPGSLSCRSHLHLSPHSLPFISSSPLLSPSTISLRFWLTSSPLEDLCRPPPVRLSQSNHSHEISYLVGRCVCVYIQTVYIQTWTKVLAHPSSIFNVVKSKGLVHLCRYSVSMGK